MDNVSRNSFYNDLKLLEIYSVKDQVRLTNPDTDSHGNFDHGNIINTTISVINTKLKLKYIFELGDIQDFMLSSICADLYQVAYYSEFDLMLEEEDSAIFAACVDFISYEQAIKSFRKNLNPKDEYKLRFKKVTSEPIQVDPFGADVPSAAPSDFR
jgi:hypothetical protein